MTKEHQLRQIRWRKKIFAHAEETGNVSQTCRYFGICRNTYYTWRRRYDAHGEAGLAERSRAPHRHAMATPPNVVNKIIYLHKHYHFGPGRIATYLKRYHDVYVAGSTVHRVLQRHAMNRLPANQKHRAHVQRWKRYEKQPPGHRLQVDVKFLERIPKTQTRLYQFTAIDDCPRLRVLKIYDACNQGTAIRFINEVINRLPFRIHVVQTDNGPEFQSTFHWHLQDLDIKHVYIKPRTPRLNGKVERSHRIDDQEFYNLLDKDGISTDIHLFNEKLRHGEQYYNHERPHGALDGQTPYERLRQKLGANLSST